MPRSMPRHALRAGSTAVAVGLLTLGATPAGHADEVPQTLEFSDYGRTVEVEPYAEDSYSNTLDATSAVNKGSQELKDFTVTIDASAFRGQLRLVALTGMSACVSKNESLLVCDGEKLNDGKPVPPGGLVDVGFRLRTLPAARAGFSGEVRISAEKDGAVLGKTGIKAAVADLGPVMDREGQNVVGAKPGAALSARTGFTQFSASGLDGVYVGVTLTQGLSFTKEFSNCEYGSMGSDHGARCHIETPVEPGRAYDLDDFPLKLDSTARHDEWHISVYGANSSYPPISHTHRGDGPELRLTERASGSGTLKLGDTSGSVRTDNIADREVLGATVDGKAGQTVRAKIGVRNNGPAVVEQWTGSEPGEDGTTDVKVTVPPGTTAVDIPDLCRAEGTSGSEAGHRIYWCNQPVDDGYFDVGQLTPYDFGLRIDKPSALAPGSVKLTNPSDDGHSENNTAAIIVTVNGKLGNGSGPAPAGGSPGGSGGTSAAGGAGTPAQDPAPHGPMAATGAGPLAWYTAGAAAVLAVGAALFTAARRRRTS
ncbi:hypothetical protein ACFV3N_09370 [Streptomyces bauhiniae]|uniref:hypothetical protein n=1 Tax=Streptomyces bauhiniae TaxID=2340725 RepID=UPI00364B8EA5